MIIKNKIFIVICLILISVFFPEVDTAVRAKCVSTEVAGISGTNSTNKISGTTRRRRRRRYIPPKRMRYPKEFNSVSDTLLAKGVHYKKIVWGSRYKHYFHVIEINLDSSIVYLKTLKAKNTNTGLSKLQEIVQNYDSLFIDSILVAVNANFWRAYSNHPIGPTICDGELIEMRTHKNWTSCFIDSKSHMYIDNFFINGKLLTADNKIFEIDYVNRRKDSNGVVLYNQFAGNVVPYISGSSIADEVKDALDQAVADAEFADSTDLELDSAGLVKEVLAMKQLSNMEFNIYKSACDYITGPAVNKETKAVVKNLKLGVVDMPLNGFVVSYGANANINDLPKPGDTIIVKFSSNVHDSIVFYNSVSGSPRLIREGKAKHEATSEGLSSRRFINMQLPRTAIGTSKDKNKIYIVVVEASSLKHRKVGASLWNLTKIMQKLGAYDAMNLDGGGSSLMIIGGKNVLSPGKPDASRRISVGLGVILDR